MNKVAVAILIAVIGVCWPWLSAGAADEGFRQVVPGRELVFPRDHGAHPHYKTEWWYFVGHLAAETGETYGYELTFFRVGIRPEKQGESRWETDSIYLTHLALTDDSGERFFHDERSSRGVFGQAGAVRGRLEVWNGDWRAELSAELLTLRAATKDFDLQLNLIPRKPLVLQGEQGFSRKGPELGQASYYSSFTRLVGTGQLQLAGEADRPVSALGWMDHEVTSEELPEGVVGWDWFAIQLNNDEELMLYQLRTEGGGIGEFSKGTHVPASAPSRTLTKDEYTLEPLDTWTSDTTGITYPSGWRVRVPGLGYDLKVLPTLKEQELITTASTGVVYWEGRCLVSGTRNGRPILGQAYVELTGYGGALDYGSR